MDLREKELLELKSFTQNVEAEVTMLLQSLQWDRKRLLEGTSTSVCSYDANHRTPKDCLQAHESNCVLRSLGYTKTDELLPDPPDDSAHTLVKFSNNQIQQIINKAANADPQFRKVFSVTVFILQLAGIECPGGTSHQPLSLSRLQLLYTADERRALHDAVVAAVPSCHDLGDLALASSNEDGKEVKVAKSRVEILAELRNMKRRRAKYRVAPKTRNYSDVLRDVIKTQMESYSEAISSTLPDKTVENLVSQDRDSHYNKAHVQNSFSTKKHRQYESAKSRDNNEDRRDLSYTRNHTYDTHHDENRHSERKERIDKESAGKRYNNRRERSDSSKRHHDSHRDRERHRDKEYSVEKYNERKTGSEHYDSRKSHGSNHRHSRNDEENGQRHALNDDRRYKSEKRKDIEDRHSDSRYYKEDSFKRKKIKEDPDEQSRGSSKHSHQSDRKRSERSGSRDRHRDSRNRKHRDDDRKYDEQREETHYKRYYDVKKEEI